MHTIALSDAKAQLSALIGRVRGGDEYEITHHGKAVARLVPVRERTRENIASAIAALKTARKGVKLNRAAGTSLKDLIHQDHPW